MLFITVSPETISPCVFWTLDTKCKFLSYSSYVSTETMYGECEDKTKVILLLLLLLLFKFYLVLSLKAFVNMGEVLVLIHQLYILFYGHF